MDLDPRLRDLGPSESYSSPQVSSYKNKNSAIHLPPPHSTGLPGVVSNGTGHPYYTIPQNGPQTLHPNLPDVEQDHEPQSTNTTKLVKQVDQQNGDIKRSRACEACRGLKVRCEPDPITKTCKRCAKAGRPCVTTEPSRKRQKKADTKVAELERKVDELTSRLNGAKHRSGSEDDSNEEEGSMELSGEYVDNHSLSRGPTSRKRRKPSSSLAPYGTEDIKGPAKKSALLKDLNSTQDNSGTHHTFASNTGTHSSIHLQVPTLDPSLPSHEYADVVDRKLLDPEMAAEIFHHYVNNMAKQMPVVTFPPQTTAGEIRQNKPKLFLAILSVASGQDHPDLQKLLQREIKHVYADSIVHRGEKSLELVQALQVSSIWCGPDYRDNARPYQIINTAAVMAMTIGLGKRKKFEKGSVFGTLKDLQQSKHSAVDLTTKESRRAWLGCYTLSSNFASVLRQPNLFRWNAYMDECIDVLEKSHDALDYDRILCQWAKMQQLGDKFTELFDQDDVYSTLTPDAICTLNDFKNQVQNLRNQIPQDLKSVIPLAVGFQAFELCVLKTAVRHELNLEESTAFGGEPSRYTRSEKAPISSAGAEARHMLSKSVHALLDEFLSFSVEDVRTIPVFQFVCMTCAATCLLRLYTRAVEAGSEFPKSVPPASLNVESYLTRLFDLLQAAAYDGKSKLAQNFQLVMLTLKSWYERRKGGRKPNVDLRVQAQPVDTGRDTPHSGYRQISVHIDKSTDKTRNPEPESKRNATFPPGTSQPSTPMQNIQNNSPLHLLSQVATSNPPVIPQQHQLNAVPTATHEAWSYPPYPTPLIQNNAQQLPYADNNQSYYPPLQDGYANPPPNPYTGVYPGINLDPGLEQAIGMTFGGEGDFCELLIGESYLSMQGLQEGQPGFEGTYDGVWNAG